MFNHIITGDCRDVLPTLPAGCVDLLFADPPFNIGIDYAGYEDDRPAAEYLDWLRGCFTDCRRLLSPTASVWVAIGPKYQAEVNVLLKSLGLHWRDSVIWHYTFGPAQK